MSRATHYVARLLGFRLKRARYGRGRPQTGSPLWKMFATPVFQRVLVSATTAICWLPSYSAICGPADV
jgi:hypothetical protein